MAEIRNELIDLSTDRGMQKFNKIFEFATAKLQKVESNIGNFLRSHGFDRRLSKDYDGRLDKGSNTQTEAIYNNQVLPLLNEFKKHRKILGKKELIIKLSRLIEQAELQEKFYLAQSTGKRLDGLNMEKLKNIQDSLDHDISNHFGGDKIDLKQQETIFKKMLEDNHRSFEKNRNEPLYKKNLQKITDSAREIGGVEFEKKILEAHISWVKVGFESGVFIMAPMTIKCIKKLASPVLPLLIGGGIYARAVMTISAKDKKWHEKGLDIGKQGAELVAYTMPIVGTGLTIRDAAKAYKRGDKGEFIALSIGAAISGAFDVMTVVAIASGVGAPAAAPLTIAKEAVKKLSVAGIKKLFRSKTAITVAENLGKSALKGSNKYTKLFFTKKGLKDLSKGIIKETWDNTKNILTFRGTIQQIKEWRISKSTAALATHSNAREINANMRSKSGEDVSYAAIEEIKALEAQKGSKSLDILFQKIDTYVKMSDVKFEKSIRQEKRNTANTPLDVLKEGMDSLKVKDHYMLNAIKLKNTVDPIMNQYLDLIRIKNALINQRSLKNRSETKGIEKELLDINMKLSELGGELELLISNINKNDFTSGLISFYKDLAKSMKTTQLDLNRGIAFASDSKTLKCVGFEEVYRGTDTAKKIFPKNTPLSRERNEAGQVEKKAGYMVDSERTLEKIRTMACSSTKIESKRKVLEDAYITALRERLPILKKEDIQAMICDNSLSNRVRHHAVILFLEHAKLNKLRPEITGTAAQKQAFLKEFASIFDINNEADLTMLTRIRKIDAATDLGGIFYNNVIKHSYLKNADITDKTLKDFLKLKNGAGDKIGKFRIFQDAFGFKYSKEEGRFMMTDEKNQKLFDKFFAKHNQIMDNGFKVQVESLIKSNNPDELKMLISAAEDPYTLDNIFTIFKYSHLEKTNEIYAEQIRKKNFRFFDDMPVEEKIKIRGEVMLELIKFIRSPQDSAKVIGSLYSKSTPEHNLYGFKSVISELIASDELTMNWKIIFLQNLKSERQCFRYHRNVGIDMMEAEFKKQIIDQVRNIDEKEYIRYKDSIDFYTGTTRDTTYFSNESLHTIGLKDNKIHNGWNEIRKDIGDIGLNGDQWFNDALLKKLKKEGLLSYDTLKLIDNESLKTKIIGFLDRQNFGAFNMKKFQASPDKTVALIRYLEKSNIKGLDSIVLELKILKEEFGVEDVHIKKYISEIMKGDLDSLKDFNLDYRIDMLDKIESRGFIHISKEERKGFIHDLKKRNSSDLRGKIFAIKEYMNKHNMDHSDMNQAFFTQGFIADVPLREREAYMELLHNKKNFFDKGFESISFNLEFLKTIFTKEGFVKMVNNLILLLKNGKPEDATRYFLKQAILEGNMSKQSKLLLTYHDTVKYEPEVLEFLHKELKDGDQKTAIYALIKRGDERFMESIRQYGDIRNENGLLRFEKLKEKDLIAYYIDKGKPPEFMSLLDSTGKSFKNDADKVRFENQFVMDITGERYKAILTYQKMKPLIAKIGASIMLGKSRNEEEEKKGDPKDTSKQKPQERQNDPKFAKYPEVWQNIGSKSFREIMSGPKARIITTLAITFGLMTAKNAQAMEPEIVEEAISDAKASLENDINFQQANAEGRQRILEATIRRLTVEKTQKLLDEMQKKVDKEFDIRLAKAFDANNLSVVSDHAKNEIKQRFKAEMYIYMSTNRSSDIKEAYSNAEGVDKNILDFMESNFKGHIGFENDIDKILKKISEDLKKETGYEVNKTWLGRLVGSIIGEFNK